MSWSFLVSVPFSESLQLVAIASMVLAIVFAILTLVDEHRRVPVAMDSHAAREKAVRKRTPVTEEDSPVVPPGIAISIRNLGKDFKTSLFKHDKGMVTAIANLHLDILKTGIYISLGSNGADCYQTLHWWRAIKPLSDSSDDADIEQLLHDCDLGKKIPYNVNVLSGGQKCKLHLAAGLVGRLKEYVLFNCSSTIIMADSSFDFTALLVDECTSGMDTLSRHALWRTLTSFLDEAYLLADTIAILAAPEELVAKGTPVALKSRSP
ncbi:uncharacterized protein LAESUDRAFT_716191 [Laetiporus sulphureus 93-53]|uniref:ABC transporter domain-containing protein n=1 Tax=Laetiporus sulphureus 93-53 TaxID=1314785 RepID=A0A165CSF9_9APHY|nr:uncharacterized protein LAESUDRAFT_716191 [Laetiporus sulphureus 93-53]KZT03357.1 hypothetical protein LAESUDRAFT_716191 [Laetiporus sulphureus 93-53]